jgi:hypothetical protein
MRITSITIIILLGVHIGLVGMDSLMDMQNEQLCKLYPSYCK